MRRTVVTGRQSWQHPSYGTGGTSVLLWFSCERGLSSSLFKYSILFPFTHRYFVLPGEDGASGAWRFSEEFRFNDVAELLKVTATLTAMLDEKGMSN